MGYHFWTFYLALSLTVELIAIMSQVLVDSAGTNIHTFYTKKEVADVNIKIADNQQMSLRHCALR